MPTDKTSATAPGTLRAAPRGFFLHVGLFLAATAFAGSLWTREKETKSLATGDVVVWSGRAGDVDWIEYASKTRKVHLDAKKDAVGRYFQGIVTREAAADSDAGPVKPTEPTTLLSVGSAQKLSESVAPLKALRALGKIADDKNADFGLAEPEATITVKVAGAERKLLVGGPTPGGSDKYVRDPSTGEVFAIKGDIVRDLDSAESRLVERDLHEWKDSEIGAAKLSAGGKTRDVVRGGVEGKRFWADPSAAETNEETLGNWMSKLERLRPLEFVATPPANKETVVRIEYLGPTKRALGFVELAKVPSASGKPDYYLTSERTRLFAKVTQSIGEQVEQDVSTIVH